MEVLSRLINWASLDAEDALSKLKKTAASIRQVDSLPRGSLVLVRVTKANNNTDEKWIYGRIAGKPENELIRVYLSPEEVLVKSVEPENVIAVAENCMQYFTSKNFIEVIFCFKKTITT